MDERGHNREKKALERAAVQQFIAIFNRNHERKLRLLYMQEKPDAVLQDGQFQKLGLEVTHLFYDAHEAQLVLGRMGRAGHEQQKVRELEHKVEQGQERRANQGGDDGLKHTLIPLQEQESGQEPARIEQLIAELNARIRSKEAKRRQYESGYPVSLLIRNASPVFGMSDILKARHQLIHPGDAFQDVWFLSRDGTPDWLLVRLEDVTK